MMKISMILLLFVLLFTVGCAPDPRDAADAQRTLALTEQDVLDRDQAREFAIDAEARRAAREEAAVKREIKREAEEQARWSQIWAAAAGGATLAAGVASFLIVTGLGLGGFKAAVGVGEAVRDMALLRANLIPLNVRTRQYPLLRQWKSADGRRLTTFGQGVYLLSNPNDGSVMGLDQSRPGDRQKIAGMTAAWELGIVASEARQSADPAGVAVVAPAAAQITAANVGYLVLDNEEN